MNENATSWIAVAIATVSLVGQIVSTIVGYLGKRSDAATNAKIEQIKAELSVEMAVLKKELEYATRDVNEERKQRAILEQKLEEYQKAELSKRNVT